MFHEERLEDTAALLAAVKNIVERPDECARGRARRIRAQGGIWDLRADSVPYVPAFIPVHLWLVPCLGNIEAMSWEQKYNVLTNKV